MQEAKTFEKDKMQDLIGVLPKNTVYSAKTIPTTWIHVDRIAKVHPMYNDKVVIGGMLVRAYNDIRARVNFDMKEEGVETYALVEGNLIAHFDGIGLKFDPYTPSRHQYQLGVTSQFYKTRYLKKSAYDSAMASLPKKVLKTYAHIDIEAGYNRYMASENARYPSDFYHLGGVGAIKGAKLNREYDALRYEKMRGNVPTLTAKASETLKGYEYLLKPQSCSKTV